MQNVRRRFRSTALAPILAAVALAGMFGANAARGPRKRDVQEYLTRVRAAIEAVPYQIGDWSGKDIEPPPAATRLLKPNKILQRQYTNTSDGRSVNLLIVHCADTRDMLGHYPPVCYPAHGWIAAGVKDDRITLDGEERPARRYSFRRSMQGSEQAVMIRGFFVVPDPKTRIASTMEELDRLWQFGPGVGLGAAQVQLVSDAGTPPEERAAVDDLMIRAIAPALRVISEGAGHEGQ